MSLLKVCLTCGQVSDEPRCIMHRSTPMPKASAHSRGYDSAWTKLSKRARELQPFCEDCGATKDLTADHSPEAWKRKEQGKTIRLCDIAVVCRSCNALRGAARGEKMGDKGLIRTAKDPRAKAKFPTDSRPSRNGVR